MSRRGAPLSLRRHLLLVALIVAVVALGSAVVVALEQPPTSTPLSATPPTPVASATLHAGSKVPLDFTLPLVDGSGRASLGALVAHRPAVVNFFASWCPACQAELTTLAAYAHSMDGRVRVVGIDTSEHDVAASRHLLAAAHARYPVLLDDSNLTVATAYGIAAGLPVTFFVDAQGRVRSDVLGKVTPSLLERRTRPLLHPGTR